MKPRAIRSIVAALAFASLLAAPSGARAADDGGGALHAVDGDGRALGACPLEHTDVHATVAGFVARVVVTQVFRSSFTEPVEAIYTFPLSERAAVDAMTMKVGDRVVAGEIRRREEARRAYEAARAAGQVASLLSEERPNVFTQSVANLMPGARVEIRIEYVEPLAFEAGTFSLVVPTVVGPRFSPPGTRDADAVTPPVAAEGTRAGHDVAIAVDLDAGVPIRALESPLHAVDIERPAPERARVRLRNQKEIPNRDFVLRWAVSGDDLQSGTLTYRPDSGDGYVSLFVLPPKRVTADTAAPKELVFVIDRSGSQMGAPLEKAKETMRWVLDHLNPSDTFQVIDFGSTSNALFETPQPASAEMKRRARAYIDALEANGGTMMADAIERVARTPADGNRLRIVTFMTDGYVGNDLEVLSLVERVRATSRWFPFGTGNGVNRFLIDGMARLGGGEAEYVLLGASGEEVARKFYERIASPVLTDVQVAWEGLEVVDVFPHRHADVWAERPLVIQARYRGAGKGQVVVTGFRQGRPYRQVIPVTLPERDVESAAIASMWARAKVSALLDQDLGALQSGSYPKPLEEQVVRVALAHRLLTPFTSFVAVEDRVVNEGGTSRTVRVPVEMPDGVRYEGVFGTRGVAEADVAAAGTTQLARVAAPVFAKRPAASSAAETAAPAGPLSDEERGRSQVTPVPSPLSDDVRRRLAEPLVVLLERGAGAPGAAAVDDGWLRVEVELRSSSADVLRALQQAGLVVESATGDAVLGVAKLEALRALAQVDGVRRIRPAARSAA
jgi:Ca-activated chloride channel family protein